MSLDKNDVEKIAHLARLAVAENDIPGYAENLSNILDLVEQMGAVDTDSRGVWLTDRLSNLSPFAIR